MGCKLTDGILYVLYMSSVISVFALSVNRNIVYVVDKNKVERKHGLLITTIGKLNKIPLTANVVESENNDSVGTLDKVCESMAIDGSVMIVDMTSPLVGPLLRSFARTLGVAHVSITDRSTLLPVDENPIHLNIEPTGSAMFQIIPDIIRHENFTKVAIMYDESFDLHLIPKRILTGVPAQHLYLDITHTTGLQAQLATLKKLEMDVFFVIAEKVSSVLEMAEKMNMTSDQYKWFVLSLTGEPYCTCKKYTVRYITGNSNFDQKVKYFDKLDAINLRPDKDSEMRMDEVFLYDLQFMLQEAMDNISTNLTSQSVHDCYGVQPPNMEFYQQSVRIIQEMKKIRKDGVFGEMYYSEKDDMLKQKLNLTVRVYKGGGDISIKTIASWTEKTGIVLKEDKSKSLVQTETTRNYRVVLAPSYPPFIYVKKNSTGHTYYDGYCIDLLNKIRDLMGFNYTLYMTPDNMIGAISDSGKWNGLIRELVDKRADIGVGPISVMAERENAVDFTVPYYDLVGLTILIKQPKFEYSLIRFLEVLEFTVWGGIVAVFFVFSALLWIFDRISPYSYQNNRDSWNGQGMEPRVFTLKEGVWFCMMSLTPQGGGEAPRALSGRLIAATWWMFGFLIIATYTANLAASLTGSRLENDIKSLDGLSGQYKLNYAPRNGSAAMVYFKRMAEIEEKFYSIWKQMSLNDSLGVVERAKLAVWDYPVSNKYTRLWETMKKEGFPNSIEEAIDNIMGGTFAYIGDSAENKYKEMTNCELLEVGEEFSRKPFAFAVQDGSPLRNELSSAILQLLNERYLEELKSKWWIRNTERIICPKIESESEGISIKNIGGVFLVIGIGTAMALVCLAFEFYLYRCRPKQESKKYGVAKTQSKADLSKMGQVSSAPLPDIAMDFICRSKDKEKAIEGRVNVNFSVDENN